MGRRRLRTLMLLVALVGGTAAALPAAASSVATPTMTLAPNAAFTGGDAPLVVTSLAAWSGSAGDLVLTPDEATGPVVSGPGTYTAPVTAQGATGTRWDAVLPLVDAQGVPAAPGLYDAALVVDGATVQECTGCFTVLTRGAPTATALSPRRMQPAEQLPVDVAGSSFADGTVVEMLLGGKPDPLLAVAGATVQAQGPDRLTRLTRDVAVDGSAVLGYRDVRTTNTDGRQSTCTRCFTVSVPADKVEPTGATNDLVRAVHVFVPAALPKGAKVRLTWVGPGAPSSALDLTSGATTVTPSGAGSDLAGPVDLTGVTPGLDAYRAGYVLPDGSVHSCEGLCRFTVRQALPPTITSLSGLSKAKTAVRTLTLTGTGFTRGTTLETDDPDVVVRSVTWTSRTAMTVVVAVAPTASGAPVTFTVANPDLQSTSFTSDPLEPAAPGPPVPVLATDDGDPDPSRAPEVPSLLLPSTSWLAQKTMQLTGRADPGTSLDLFALAAPATAPVLLRTTTLVADDGQYSFLVAPLTRTCYVVVSRNSFGRSPSSSLCTGVKPLVTIGAPSRSTALRYRFSGTVFPRRAGVRVQLFDLGRPARTLLGSALTRSDGTWQLAKPNVFRKAATVKVQAVTLKDARNLAGQSAVKAFAAR